MNATTGLKMLDAIELTGTRIDLLTARVQYLEWMAGALLLVCVALFVLSLLLFAMLYCLARATIGPPPWEKMKPATCGRRFNGNCPPCNRPAGHSGPHGQETPIGILAPWTDPTPGRG